jgi:predicted MFS family arabinose efflux permease
VAGVIAAVAGAIGPGLAVLVVPGAASLLLLVILRRATSDPAAPTWVAEEDSGCRRSAVRVGLGGARLPAAFWWFSVAAGLCTAGLVTFGLIGFHLAHRGIVPTAAVPVLYALAMAAGAAAALLTGVCYDRVGARVLLVLPLLIAAVPALAFGRTVLPVTVGVVLWGAAVGLQDSTVKALVAELVDRGRRATAYGWFAAVQGLGALIGGASTGLLYERSISALIVAVGCTQLVALTVLLVTAPRRR